MQATKEKKLGLLISPSHCADCKNEVVSRLDMHHPDYAKPIEVLWLCRSCHIKRHPRLRRTPLETRMNLIKALGIIQSAEGISTPQMAKRLCISWKMLQFVYLGSRTPGRKVLAGILRCYPGMAPLVLENLREKNDGP